MPERERAAGAGRPLLYFQLASEQKVAMEPEQAGAVESPDSLLSHR
ncbi:MAG: hypothetical protein RLZZ274_1257 [Cyanobacteriota bacterium]|jgi:hypothetical protein